MKILQIINSHALSDGGAQRLALELHRAYLERGHDAHLLSLMRSPTDEPNTYSLGFDSPYRAAVWPRLLRFLRQKRWRDVQVIHVHLFPAQPLVALAVTRLGIRTALITTEHNTFNRRRSSLPGRLLDRITLRAYRKIICISDATRDALEAWQPAARGQLVTVQNGIDLTRFDAPLSAAPRAPHPKSAHYAPLIVSLGRISAQKNYAGALRALALLGDENFRFQIAGQDEMSGEMQILARELGIADRVEFLGFQSDVPALLQGADIFLLTSSWEGFGLAVAEAMAAGLPVVVPDVPGVRELVGAGEKDVAGILVNPQESASIAAGLQSLLLDADLRRNLGTRGRVRAEIFDIRGTIDAHLELYERLCSLAPLPRV